MRTVADPGFPRGGGTLVTRGGGGPRYNFIKFSRKLHEIKKHLVARGGGGAGGAPPRSATGVCFHLTSIRVVNSIKPFPSYYCFFFPAVPYCLSEHCVKTGEYRSLLLFIVDNSLL